MADDDLQCPPPPKIARLDRSLSEDMEIQTEIEMMKDRISAIKGQISALEAEIVDVSENMQMEKDKLASLTESGAVEKCEGRIKSLIDDKKILRNLIMEKTKLLTETTKLMLMLMQQREHIFLPKTEAVKFFEAFTKECQLNENGKVLSISSYVLKELSFDSTGNNILVRKAYSTFERVAEEQNDLLIIGNPGIGKSIFGLYLFWKYVSTNRSVIFQRSEDCYVFLGEGQYFYFPYFKDCRKHPLVSTARGIPWIFDAVGKHQCVPFRSFPHHKAIVMSSPEHTNFKDYLHQRSPSLRCMPIWSMDEIMELRSYHSVEASVVEARYDQFGGIPRYVFASTTGIKLYESERKSAISNNYLQVFSLQEGNKFPVMSHYIIKLQSSDRDDFLTYHIEFTTDYVRHQVYKQLKDAELSSIINFVQTTLTCLAADSHQVTSFTGKTFEMAVHKTFDQLKKVEFLQVRHLTPQKSTKVQDFTTLTIDKVVNYDGISNIEAQEAVLYIPLQSNNPTFDSLLISDGIFYLFQMVISPSHRISTRGFHELLKNKRIKALSNKKIKIQFYFVVPEFIYNKSYSSKVSLDEEEFDSLHIEQYVALFDFDNARRKAVHGLV